MILPSHGRTQNRTSSFETLAFSEIASDFSDSVVRLEDVRKSYHGNGHVVEALTGINLNVQRGSIQGVIGFSGAGKSTLLRCISRLEQPDSGRVIVTGTDLSPLKGQSLRRARQQMGVVFQHLNLLRSRTVAANVGLALELEGKSRSEVQKRVEELLDWFGLSEKASQYPSQLSGGQQQRVATARALAMSPKVLLTDEPTSALDPETTSAVLALLRRVQRDFDVTILLITHELDAVRAVCNRVAVLDAGSIVEEGPVERVLLNPKSPAGKRLVRRELGSAPEMLPSNAKGGETSSSLFELQMFGKVVAEPVFSLIAQKHAVDVRILRAHVDRLNATNFGFLLVQLSGNRNDVQAACETLRSSGVGVSQMEQASPE